MKEEWEFNFFTKVRQQSFFAKHVAQSCKTLDQLDNVARWMVVLRENWVNEIDMQEDVIGARDVLILYNHFKDEYEEIDKEWNDIVKSKREEISPNEEEPQPKPPVVITGFC